MNKKEELNKKKLNYLKKTEHAMMLLKNMLKEDKKEMTKDKPFLKLLELSIKN